MKSISPLYHMLMLLLLDISRCRNGSLRFGKLAWYLGEWHTIERDENSTFLLRIHWHKVGAGSKKRYVQVSLTRGPTCSVSVTQTFVSNLDFRWNHPPSRYISFGANIYELCSHPELSDIIIWFQIRLEAFVCDSNRTNFFARSCFYSCYLLLSFWKK